MLHRPSRRRSRRLPDSLRRNEANLRSMFPGVRVFAYGHIGDGNLHYHIGRPIDAPETYLATNGADIHARLCKTTSSASVARSRLNTASADQNATRCCAHKSPIELRLMHVIKDALDPQGIMDPGQLLPRRLHPGDV
ncbi:MAG: hypothetical protein MZV49_18220 [Rhodopseudomonas palustris]|nr:hypothetical protein [Rhodopseudomonas palustris]